MWTPLGSDVCVLRHVSTSCWAGYHHLDSWSFYLGTLHTQRGQCILFSVVFTPSPPATTAVFGSTNTVSPMRVCLTIWWESFHGNQKEDDYGPLSIQSSLYTQIQTRCFWRPKVRRRKGVVGFREKEIFTNLKSFRDIRFNPAWSGLLR